MNMSVQRELTAVEAEIINNFNQRIDSLPGNKAVLATRKRAVELLRKKRLLRVKLKNWHYTDLRTLLKSVSDFSEVKNRKSLDPLLPENVTFSIENGEILLQSKLKNIAFKSFADALKEDDAKINQVLVDEDFIGQLNTAFVTDGWVFKIPENTKLDNPIELQNIQMGGQSHIFSDIEIGKNSQITVIERQIGNDESTFASSVFSLRIAEYSDVTWILIRDRGVNSTQFGKFRAVLGNNAKLSLYVLNIGSQLNRQEVDIELQERESNFHLRAINLLSGQTHSDLTMTVRHIEEKSTSTEIVRNVVTGKARGVFQGMIRVAKEAQKTDARMACNSLVLSDNSEFDAKPELEIFADDVVCAHGATVSKVDRDHIFYLMARGIPFKIARELLIKGFVSELVDSIERDHIKAILNNFIAQWLDKNI
ncbi:Fe-S cluster assembly protein SufD [Bartonella ancashensis]|nr:Fe-S cluster assembly protein SufD [Bartonella ancashensis]